VGHPFLRLHRRHLLLVGRERAVLPPSATPVPGDAVLYGTSPYSTATSVHTGIVAQVWPDGAVVTIEGDAGPAPPVTWPSSPTGRTCLAVAQLQRLRHLRLGAALVEGTPLLEVHSGATTFRRLLERAGCLTELRGARRSAFAWSVEIGRAPPRTTTEVRVPNTSKVRMHQRACGHRPDPTELPRARSTSCSCRTCESDSRNGSGPRRHRFVRWPGTEMGWRCPWTSDAMAPSRGTRDIGISDNPDQRERFAGNL